jgi:hypothetical protein
MAYISKEDVKKIRDAIKKEFPKYKFSVTGRHYSSIEISLMEADFDVSSNYQQLNHYYLKEHFKDESEIVRVFTRVVEIMNGVKVEEDRNAGDPYVDYPDCTYFVHIAIGKWDKPYKKVA